MVIKSVGFTGVCVDDGRDVLNVLVPVQTLLPDSKTAKPDWIYDWNEIF